MQSSLAQLTFQSLLPGRRVDGHQRSAHDSAGGVSLKLGHGGLHQLQTHRSLRVREGAPGVGAVVAGFGGHALMARSACGKQAGSAQVGSVPVRVNGDDC